MKKLLMALCVLGVLGNASYASDQDIQATDDNEIVSADSFSAETSNMLHPPQQLVTCYSQDHHGYTYSARGYNAHDVQHEAHHHCEDHSGSACWDLGCRRF